MNIDVQDVKEASLEMVDAFRRLLPQLAASSATPTEGELVEMLADQAISLFVAKSSDGEILGMLTLLTVRIPTRVRAWIEDVVVDESARGFGVGVALCNAALAKAAAAGVSNVNLTSRPSRIAANRLYQRLGFELRETNVYRYNF